MELRVICDRGLLLMSYYYYQLIQIAHFELSISEIIKFDDIQKRKANTHKTVD